MLSSERAERLLAMPSFDDAAEFLAALGYPDMSGMDAFEVEGALEGHMRSVFDGLLLFFPHVSPAVDLFRLRYDYSNAKAVVKSATLRAGGYKTLSRCGRVSPEDLVAAHKDGGVIVPPVLGGAMSDAAAILHSGGPREADNILDRAYFKELLEISELTGNAVINTYAKLNVDCANLRITVRSLRAGIGAHEIGGALIHGGTVGADRLSDTLSTSGDFAAEYEGTPLERAARSGLAAVAAKGGRISKFERLCDDALNDYLYRVKLSGFGIEPVAAFLFALESEVKAVRLILAGRRFNIDAEIIRETLRERYV
jgi:V/A-type H+-transporting ATPase subunit C